MNKHLIILFLANISLTMRKDQFLKNQYHESHFGPIKKLLFLPKNQVVIFNELGFTSLDLTNGNILYQEDETIEQVYTTSNNKAIIFNKESKKIYLFDLVSGSLIKNIKFQISNFEKFLYDEDEKVFYFIGKNNIFSEDNEGKLEEIIFDFEINQVVLEKNSKSLFVIDNSTQKIIKVSDFKNKEVSNLEIRQFNKEQTFDVNLFVTEEKNLISYLKWILEETNFKRIYSLNNSITLLQNKNGFSLQKDNKELINFVKEDLSSIPEKIFANEKFVLTQEKDLTISCFSLLSKTLLFRKEESLSQIEDILFFKTHLKKEHWDFFNQYENLIQQNKFLQAWNLRIRENIKNLHSFIFKSFKNINEILGMIVSLDHKGLQNFFEGRTNINSEGDLAVVVTRPGKLFLFNIGLKKFVKSLTVDNLFTKNNELNKNECHVLKNESGLLVNCEENNFSLDLNFEKIENKNVEAKEPKRSFKIDRENNEIRGFYEDRETWNLKFSENEKIYNYEMIDDRDTTNKSIFVAETKTVLYKLIDPNNIIFLTKSVEIEDDIENITFNVYLLNIKFGRVLGRFVTDRISENHPIKLLVDDNSFFVIYYCLQRKITEIWNFELFRTKVEKAFVRIVKDNIYGQQKSFDEIDYSANENEFILLHKKFGLDLIFKNVKAFTSHNDLTSKNLIFLTKNNQVYSLNRETLSTRRCTADEKEAATKNLERTNERKIIFENYFKSQILPDYKYKIEIDPLAVISRNVKLFDLNNLFVGATDYESTSNLIFVGKSFMFVTHSPNKLFDKLPESFDKLKLFLLFAVLLGAVYGTKRYLGYKSKFKKFNTD